jgi:hypothetical protein
MKLVACVVICLIGLYFLPTIRGDCYMHTPRGSNNRLNGTGTNRNNNNRLFNTQNNAKGGYVWGPKMTYIAGSQLTIEWTQQHGNGKNPKVWTNVVIQYMCNDDSVDMVRDGVVTTSPPDDQATYNEMVDITDSDTGQTLNVHKYGMHEPYWYYQDCKARERNRGLFLADQNLNNKNTARFTRQQPGGGRNGFECPEERDYYPYWHPTPWRDIALLTHDTSRCSYYRRKTQNKRSVGYCSDNRFNNKGDCQAAKASWKKRSALGGDFYCGLMSWSRDNHLGNTKTGHPHFFNWTIPDRSGDNCVLRMRYNISTADFDPWNTYADKNGANSPVVDDPTIQWKTDANPPINLTLALDTTQFGRTFQDRTHAFRIRKRPSRIGALDRIFNLNVRGKRGNIVQVYPAVEYDFVPNRFHVKRGDWVHAQWTGGDRNPAGNDGEGTNQTDRSNLILIPNLNTNLPRKFSSSKQFFGSSDRQRTAYLDQTACDDYATLLANNGGNQGQVDQDVRNCFKLNSAGRYFDLGAEHVGKEGVYAFMSSRNNNFTNRSQKNSIIVNPFLPIWAILLLSAAAAMCLGAVVVSGLAFYGSTHPHSQLGRVWTAII